MNVPVKNGRSSYSAWKTLERRIAKLFQGTRLWRPDFSESIPDGENDTHTWDTKAYANHAAITMYVQNEKKYREFTGGRQFVLVLFSRKYPKAGDFVLVPAKHYAALNGWLDPEQETDGN